MADEGKHEEIQLSPLLEKLAAEYAEDPTSKKFRPLAEEYRKSRMYEEAIYICKEGLKHHPAFAPGMITLARCYHETNENEQALIALLPLVDEQPDNIPALRLIAEVYFSLGDVDKAIEAYQDVLKVSPEDEAAREGLERVKTLGNVVEQDDEDSEYADVEPIDPFAERVEAEPAEEEEEEEAVDLDLDEDSDGPEALDLSVPEPEEDEVMEIEIFKEAEEEEDTIITDEGGVKKFDDDPLELTDEDKVRAGIVEEEITSLEVNGEAENLGGEDDDSADEFVEAAPVDQEEGQIKPAAGLTKAEPEEEQEPVDHVETLEPEDNQETAESTVAEEDERPEDVDIEDVPTYELNVEEESSPLDEVIAESEMEEDQADSTVRREAFDVPDLELDSVEEELESVDSSSEGDLEKTIEVQEVSAVKPVEADDDIDDLSLDSAVPEEMELKEEAEPKQEDDAVLAMPAPTEVNTESAQADAIAEDEISEEDLPDFLSEGSSESEGETETELTLDQPEEAEIEAEPDAEFTLDEPEAVEEEAEVTFEANTDLMLDNPQPDEDEISDEAETSVPPIETVTGERISDSADDEEELPLMQESIEEPVDEPEVSPSDAIFIEQEHPSERDVVEEEEFTIGEEPTEAEQEESEEPLFSEVTEQEESPESAFVAEDESLASDIDEQDVFGEETPETVAGTLDDISPEQMTEEAEEPVAKLDELDLSVEQIESEATESGQKSDFEVLALDDLSGEEVDELEETELELGVDAVVTQGKPPAMFQAEPPVPEPDEVTDEPEVLDVVSSDENERDMLLGDEPQPEDFATSLEQEDDVEEPVDLTADEQHDEETSGEDIFESSEAQMAEAAPVAEESEDDAAPVTLSSARIFEQQGHTEKALDIYRKLHEADPDNEELAFKVKELEPEEVTDTEVIPEEPKEMLQRWLKNIEAYRSSIGEE